MGVTTEEARAKLSLDTSDLGRGGRDIESFADKSHKSFLHAGSAARSFKGVLERITESSPLIGEALKFALNPIVGILGGLTLGFNIFREKLKEVNTFLDTVAKTNVSGVKGLSEAIVAAHKVSVDERAKFNEAVRDLVNPLDEIAQMLKREELQLKVNYELAKARRDMEKEAVLAFVSQQGMPKGVSDAVGAHYTAEERRARIAQAQSELETQRRLYGTISEARHKVAGDVYSDMMGGGAARDRMRQGIARAGKGIEATQADIAAKRAIMEMTQGDYDEAASAAQGGKINLAKYALTHTPDATLRVSQYIAARQAAESMTANLNKQIAARERLIALEQASLANSERSAKDLKDLDKAYAEYGATIAKLEGELTVLRGPTSQPEQRSPLDPATGGYALRPIQSRGGIPYVNKLIQGPMLKPIQSAMNKETQDSALLRQLVDLAASKGILIRIPDDQ